MTNTFELLKIAVSNTILTLFSYLILILNHNKIKNRKKILVFGRYGDFIDNGKYLFIYLYKKRYDVYFIGYSDRVLNLSKKNSRIVFFDRSLKGLISISKLLLSARIIIADDPYWGRWGIYPLTKNAKKIFMYHGFGPKWWLQFRVRNFFRRIFFGFGIKIKYDLIISFGGCIKYLRWISLVSEKKYDEAVNILPVGYPRNVIINRRFKVDNLHLIGLKKEFNEVKKLRRKGYKVIFYLPTFSRNKKEDIMHALNIINIVNRLNKRVVLILKFHPALDVSQINFDNLERNVKVVIFDSKKDIYPLLRFADVLITDYSSIYVDVALNKEVAILFDHRRKITEYGFPNLTLIPFDDLYVGKICKDSECIFRALSKLLDDVEYYHKYVRMSSKIRKLISQDNNILQKIEGWIQNVLE